MESTKKKLSKKAKIIVSVVVVIAVIIAGFITVKANETAFYKYALYTFMPKTLTAEEINADFDVSVRFNEEYNAETQSSQPLEAFEYYYTDPDTGKEVVIKGTENAVINGEEVPIYLGFLIEAQMNLATMKSVLSKVAIALAVVIVVVAIVVWFFIWSKKEDEEKEKYLRKTKGKK